MYDNCEYKYILIYADKCFLALFFHPVNRLLLYNLKKILHHSGVSVLCMQVTSIIDNVLTFNQLNVP